jgi:branched-chain amino acid transport system ATP-binding protein
MSLLEVKNVCKSFGGLQALKDVSMAIMKGEILSLIGPNGSGKTTLINVITGFYKPDSGNVIFNGKIITNLKPHKICKLGIARTFQIVRPLKKMTVEDNVLAGLLFGRKRLDIKEAKREVDKILELTGLYGKKGQIVENLTMIDKRRLELARALACDPILVLADEVMAGLTPTEVNWVVEVLKRIREELGITFLIVEHVMSAVMQISDRVVVLNQGEIIADGKPEDVVKDENVIKAYLGGWEDVGS